LGHFQNKGALEVELKDLYFDYRPSLKMLHVINTKLISLMKQVLVAWKGKKGSGAWQ